MMARHIFLGAMLGTLAISSLAAQTLVLSSVEAPYPALQSQVTLGGATWGKGSVAYGSAGTPLVLTGSGLGSSGTVEFIGYKNGAPDAGYTLQVTASSWSSTVVYVNVPAGATSGLIKLISEGRSSNGLPFMVTPGSYGGSCPATIPSTELQITTSGLDDGIVGQSYSATLAATGGTQAYTWSNPDGSLPSGLTLSSAGVISGTPTQAVGSVNVTVQVTDSSSPAQTTRAVLNLTVAASGQPSVVYTYTVGGYDPAGNLLSYTDSVMGTWSMSGGYDTLNRLTAATATAGVYQGLQANWSDDAFGNRTAETFSGTLQSPNAPPIPASTSATYSAGNQVQTASGMAVPTYDASGDGDVTNDGQNQYLYDGEGRVCAIKNMIGKMVQYLYDAEGTRVAKGTITTFSCNTATNGFALTTSYILTPGNQQLTELTWSGNTPQWAHTNVWAAGQLLATYSADPDPTQNVQGILNFYIDDPLGTRRVMTDFAGNIQETCHTLPYGNGADCGPAPTEHLFTGKERDAESGNDYFGARYYASSMGRFLTPDWSAKVEPVPYSKLDDPQTLNLYTYVGNNPFTRIDGDGHDCSMSSGGSTPECNASEKATAVEDYVFGQGGFAVGMRPGDPPAQQQNGSSGPGFWGRLGQRFNNFFHENGFVTNAELDQVHGAFTSMYIVPGSVQEIEPNSYITLGLDAAGIGATLTGHAYAEGGIAAGSSIYNPDPMNLGLNGMSLVPGVGEAAMPLTVVNDVGGLAGGVITNNVMAPMLEAIPGNTMVNGNGISIPNPAAMDGSELIDLPQ